MADFRFNGLDELEAAVRRSPARVIEEAAKFFARGLSVYRRIIFNNPWRVGMSGGGAPVRTGNLRQTHVQEIRSWDAAIYPTAPYAWAVHEGLNREGVANDKKARPWLDYAQAQGDKQIQELETQLLENIVGDLAK